MTERLRRIVQNDHDRFSTIRQPAKERKQPFRPVEIQRRSRFVQQKNRRILHRRTQQGSRS